MALPGTRAPFRQREADELLPPRLTLENLQAALPDEERLRHTQGPLRADLQRIGQAVGVLADDHVAFLETQDSLRFDTERTDAEALARAQHRVPDTHGVACRKMDFVSHLAHE